MAKKSNFCTAASSVVPTVNNIVSVIILHAIFVRARQNGETKNCSVHCMNRPIYNIYTQCRIIITLFGLLIIIIKSIVSIGTIQLSTLFS
jgi:hypothetical protein